MDRISSVFERTQRYKRACFIAYVCAGDPDFETSLAVCQVLIEAGVDILELGVPFSDPLADGLTNQLAAQRALAAGMNQAKVLELAGSIRRFSQIPIVLYTYYNLVFSKGVEAYVSQLRKAEVDGLLTLDLPPEEAEALVKTSREKGLRTIFIVTLTTPEERIKKIATAASGFIYYVSRKGVTGERDDLAPNLREAIAKIKRHTALPVVVGFGISNADQVRQVGACADGVVVGSALVNCIACHATEPAKALAALKVKVNDLLQGLTPDS